MFARLAAAAAAMGLLLAACGGAGGQAGAGAQAGAEGPTLPKATLPVLGGVGQLATTELRGTPAVINFWATWCPFCIEEMPDIERVHQELEGKVTFVGVDREDVTDKALRLAQETGVTYTLVEDPDGSFFRAAQGLGMPTTLFVDADGTIVHRQSGPMDAEQLRSLIRTHLGV